MMMFVVVANNVDKQKAIITSIEEIGQSVTALSSLAELPDFLQKTPISGILLDLITSTRASSLEKEATNDLIQLYPNVKVKVIDNEVLILGGGITLHQFVENSRSFKPRTVRKSARKIRHIAFLLSADSKFEKPEKVVTLNIAEGGCFICSTGEWQIGDRVWLRFADNENVMTAVVCWWQPWGNNKKMPGIGVIFD